MVIESLKDGLAVNVDRSSQSFETLLIYIDYLRSLS